MFEPLKLSLIRFHLKWYSSSIQRVLDTHISHSFFSWQFQREQYQKNKWSWRKGVFATSVLVQSKMLFDLHNICKMGFAFDASSNLSKPLNSVARKELVDLWKTLTECRKDETCLYSYVLFRFLPRFDIDLVLCPSAVLWNQKLLGYDDINMIFVLVLYFSKLDYVKTLLQWVLKCQN